MILAPFPGTRCEPVGWCLPLRRPSVARRTRRAGPLLKTTSALGQKLSQLKVVSEILPGLKSVVPSARS